MVKSIPLKDELAGFNVEFCISLERTKVLTMNEMLTLEKTITNPLLRRVAAISRQISHGRKIDLHQRSLPIDDIELVDGRNAMIPRLRSHDMLIVLVQYDLLPEPFTMRRIHCPLESLQDGLTLVCRGVEVSDEPCIVPDARPDQVAILAVDVCAALLDIV